MVGYGLATGRSAAAAGGLRRVGQGVSEGLSKSTAGLDAASAPRRGPIAPAESPHALQVQDPASRSSRTRVVYAAWGDEPTGVSRPAESDPTPAAPSEGARRPDAAPDGPTPQDPASEALARVRVGMSVAEAMDLLGEPSMAFVGVSGDGYNAKYVFQVHRKRVIALALDGIVTRVLTP